MRDKRGILKVPQENFLFSHHVRNHIHTEFPRIRATHSSMNMQKYPTVPFSHWDKKTFVVFTQFSAALHQQVHYKKYCIQEKEISSFQ